MSGEAYIGTTKRTFRHALVRLLETDYGLLGSRRVLEMLAEDVERLVNEFHPPPDRLSSGWMVFTGTKASGGRIRPGQSASDHELVTLAWPVLIPEDVQRLAQGRFTAETRRHWFKTRLIRIIEYGWNHPKGPVLLTLAAPGAGWG